MKACASIQELSSTLLHDPTFEEVYRVRVPSRSRPDSEVTICGSREDGRPYFGSALFDMDVLILSFSRAEHGLGVVPMSEMMALAREVLGDGAERFLYSIKLTSSRVRYVAALVRGAELVKPSTLQFAHMSWQLDATPCVTDGSTVPA